MSRQFFTKVNADANLKKEVANAIQSVAKGTLPTTKQGVHDFVSQTMKDPRRKVEMSNAIAAVAKKHGCSWSSDEVYDGELSEQELELIAGGPTAVEYAVMLSLIIVVCLAAVSVLGKPTQKSSTPVSGGTGADSSGSLGNWNG